MSYRTFFSRIKSYIIQNKDYDPEGRFYSICLAEVLHENHKLRHALAPHIASIDAEAEYAYWPLRTDISHCRRADVSIVNKYGKPIAFVEVKCKDNFIKGQLEDYIHYARHNNLLLIFLTRTRLYPKEIRKLKASKVIYHTMNFNQLYHLLIRCTDKHFPLSTMFIDYLRESEMIYERHMSNGISLLLLRTFSGKSQRNRAFKATRSMLIEDLPEAIRVGSSNTYFLADAISSRMSCRGKIPRPSINFWVVPCTPVAELQSLAKWAEKQDDDYVRRKPSINAGKIWFEATITLSKSINDWCALQFGIVAKLDDSATSSIRLCFYSCFAPDTANESYIESKPFKYYSNRRQFDLGDEDVAINILVDLIKQSKQAYVKLYKNKADSCPKEYRHLKLVNSFLLCK